MLAPLIAELKPQEISKWTFIGIMVASLLITSIIKDPKKIKEKEQQINKKLIE